MTKLLGKPEMSWVVSALIACGLLAGAILVPLWRMELVAPQYPKGLVMYAYGYKFEDDPSSYYDDVREINELNHYIGMKKIVTVNEMKMFIPGIAALIFGTLAVSFVAWKRRWAQALIALAFWVMPLFFVVDLQYWLYHYGHTMDPAAALNVGAFTPKVMGSTKVMNFHSVTSFQTGFYLMVAAALVITFGPILGRRLQQWRSARRQEEAAPAAEQAGAHGGRAAAFKILILVALLSVAALPIARAGAQDTGGGGQPTLQQRIDAAAPEEIVVVDGGVFRESIRIDKPISLVGRNWPIIDGGGQGDVVTISADDAVISGFEIRNSSESLSREPADIKVMDANRVKIRGNRLRDAHFGIHMTASEESLIEQNDIDAGADQSIERRGHGIYLWEVSRSTVHSNTIRNAADGIHLEFSDDNGIGANEVYDSRYALHLMTAHANKIVGNNFRENLTGAVLMFSHDLIVKDNEMSSNRRGATGAGMLLKDDNNLFVEGNRILRNKYGATIDGTPSARDATAVFYNNLFALNDVGIAVMSNSPITFVENAMIDNTVQVKAMSGDLASRALSTHGGADTDTGTQAEDAQNAALPKGALWTSNGRGNYWSDYRGYDADGDGTGDQAYQPRPPFAGRLAGDDTLRLFQFTPAQQAIDAATDLFPVYRYNAVMKDEGPLMHPPAGLTLPHGGDLNVELLVSSATIAALSGLAIVTLSGVSLRRGLRRIVEPRGRSPGGAAA